MIPYQLTLFSLEKLFDTILNVRTTILTRYFPAINKISISSEKETEKYSSNLVKRLQTDP